VFRFFFIVLAHIVFALTVHAESSAPHSAPPASVNAEFRGCESTGWCRFWIESRDRTQEAIYRVYPDGVARMPAGNPGSVAIRDRLNTLLASMIHQSKRIVLRDLRELGDGTFAATITVNEMNVSSDPVLLELQGKPVNTTQ
jgi:hypothetical protein